MPENCFTSETPKIIRLDEVCCCKFEKHELKLA
jgi:hypothetical protein